MGDAQGHPGPGDDAGIPGGGRRPAAAAPFPHRAARAAVETVGAAIGLAETTLVFDANGAYRAEQVLRVDNSTEQFLEIRLPEGARALDGPRGGRAGQTDCETASGRDHCETASGADSADQDGPRRTCATTWS